MRTLWRQVESFINTANDFNPLARFQIGQAVFLKVDTKSIIEGPGYHPFPEQAETLLL